MKTNLENYEERFVDYMEGQLDASEMHEVEAFVAQHPELEEDFKLFCSTKLEPDTNVVYTKKGNLVQPTTTIRPLFVKIAAAAACVALLIGLGIHFLKPRQEWVQPMLAELTPIKAQPLSVSFEAPTLRKSHVKANPIPRTVSKPQKTETEDPAPIIETFAPIDMIASLSPITPKPLQWDNTIYDDAIETSMYIDLGERLAATEPFADPEIELYLTNQKELAITTLHDSFVGNVRQTTKTIYKRTAKRVMDIYYTTDYKINEAKDQLMASR